MKELMLFSARVRSPQCGYGVADHLDMLNTGLRSTSSNDAELQLCCAALSCLLPASTLHAVTKHIQGHMHRESELCCVTFLLHCIPSPPAQPPLHPPPPLPTPDPIATTGSLRLPWGTSTHNHNAKAAEYASLPYAY